MLVGVCRCLVSRGGPESAANTGRCTACAKPACCAARPPCSAPPEVYPYLTPQHPHSLACTHRSFILFHVLLIYDPNVTPSLSRAPNSHPNRVKGRVRDASTRHPDPKIPHNQRATLPASDAAAPKRAGGPHQPQETERGRLGRTPIHTCRPSDWLRRVWRWRSKRSTRRGPDDRVRCGCL